ncbi:dienelactone hydrolase family protein [Byssothecium circinans]|uniref:Dienelactone hydrolase family protein n=1 Tax=Byssothecium circinans TaxID=147558 RepID=A0A6A5U9V0_9PLEO|nr:dienelactone hydrolase family protein [Byssothecium circinans]
MRFSPVFTIAGIAGLAAAFRGQGVGCDDVTQVEGCKTVGTIKNISGVEIYHSYPPNYAGANRSKVILFITDIYGIAAERNKLLADHIAKANYPVIIPDLFAGDPVPVEVPEGSPAFNITEWWTRHPVSSIDAIVASTISYIQSELGGQRIGAVGYCLGGKYVPRFMAAERGPGIDVGFIAHPSNLTPEEISAIGGPISLATGQFDPSFNDTLRRGAVDILQAMNATFQTNLYSGAKHGFGVRVNVSLPQEKYAKAAAYAQAVQWFDAWL